jgi:putative intracellular protease/amidase
MITAETSRMAAGERAAVADHHMRVDRVSSRPKKVLIVVANPATSTTLGWPIGFWGAELAHPYYELTQRGVAVTIASPGGGRVEMDALSDPRDAWKWSADDLITHVEESFSGDISGDGVVEFLQAARADGSASFVGIERVTGTVAGRSGTFLLQDAGTVQDNIVSGDWFVIPGSGTGGLAGLHGTGGFRANLGEGAQVRLDYWFE